MKKLYTFFSLMSLLCAGAAAQPKWGENLVQNPGFGDGMTGWTRNNDKNDEGCYTYGAVVAWSDEGRGKSKGDSCLAFSYDDGRFEQYIFPSDHGFGEADLDGASAVVSVEAYYTPDIDAEAKSFSAYFIFEGRSDQAELDLVPDTVRGGLLSWTTFCDTLQLPPYAGRIQVLLRGRSGKGWWGYYGPKFDNVSVSIIRGGVTALPASPAVAPDASSPLFDLQGRRVARPVRGRPYVEGGRLKVAR